MIEDFVSSAFEWLMIYVAIPLVMIALVAFVIALPFIFYYAWNDDNSPTFSLSKVDWSCTDTQTITTMVMVDKIMMPVTDTVCVQWTWN